VAGSRGMTRKTDPRRVPGHQIEVLEKNTETSWAMFQALQDEHERGFEKTEPARLPTPAKATPAALTAEDVLQLARRNNRVCPKPLVWQRLFDWLPNKGAQLPQVPATRAEWEQMPALEKSRRLREHIEWAAMQGVLQKVHDGLKALPEERWHHAAD
jgi:hypothetical protein